ncbi:energy-converting hydrogenase B subunit J [Methanobacterium sp. ACI-7]|uniref:energy-converting hydrogenase B subunit J n=1 Tax=unclassified Methanobacterium TaxID=2627676 RepID=UPI0039C02553
MIIYIGPVALGLLLGFILGTRIKPVPDSEIKFGAEVYAIVLITAIIVAYFLGAFPYYQDIPLAVGFVSGIIGLILGKVTLGR